MNVIAGLSSATANTSTDHLLSISNEVQDFISILKDLLFNALNILHLSTRLEQQSDPTVTLDALNSLIAGVSRFTDESIESIARHTSASLNELSLRDQELNKKLYRTQVSMRVFNLVFSSIVICCAAVACPVATIAVEPLLQRFDALWDELMRMNPCKEKKKVLQTIYFLNHSAIAKAGVIKNAVHGLKVFVAEHKDLEGVEKAVHAALAQVELAELELLELAQTLILNGGYEESAVIN